MRIPIVLLALLLITPNVSVSGEPESQWFSSSNQLIREYHIRSKEPLPDPKMLSIELRNSEPQFAVVASRYLKERDAFKKRDLGIALKEQVSKTIKGEPNAFITFMYWLYLEPYDFSKKRFGVCFDDRCAKKREYPVHSKFGARKYELSVLNTPNRIFFSPQESIARVLESVASKYSRKIPAALIVAPKKTDSSRKWSDGTPYKVIESEIVGIYFMRSPPRNMVRGPSKKEIIYYIGKN